MRILNVVPTYYPAVRYGGPIYSVHGLARGLAARGHEVHVYTTNVDGPSTSNVPLGHPVDIDGVSISYFPTGAGRRLYRSPDMALALKKNVAEFDVVHAHSVFLWPTTAAARAARAHGVPYIIAPRGMLVRNLIRRKSWLLKWAWILAFEHHNFSKAAAIHVTSEVEATDIEALGLLHPDIIVVPNGTELPVEKVDGASITWRRPTILYLGRINWKKGIDRLIEAMALLPEADLAIVGTDDEGYTADLKSLVDSLGVAPRIHFLGPMHGARKWALLSSVRALVLPSCSENFGNVVLEAMASSCPVIVTPEVGLAETVRKSGAGLVVPARSETLAQALRTILENPEAAHVMGEAGRETVQAQFTWEVAAREMEKAYRRIAATAISCSARSADAQGRHLEKLGS